MTLEDSLYTDIEKVEDERSLTLQEKEKKKKEKSVKNIFGGTNIGIEI